MKSNLPLLFLVAFISCIAAAEGVETKTRSVHLDDPAFNLAVDAPLVSLRIDYPGLGSKAVCALQLQLNDFNFSTMENVANTLQIEEVFDHETLPIQILDSKTGVIELSRGFYVTTLSISSRDHRDLKETLNLGPAGQLLLTAKGCPSSIR